MISGKGVKSMYKKGFYHIFLKYPHEIIWSQGGGGGGGVGGGQVNLTKFCQFVLKILSGNEILA